MVSSDQSCFLAVNHLVASLPDVSPWRVNKAKLSILNYSVTGSPLGAILCPTRTPTPRGLSGQCLETLLVAIIAGEVLLACSGQRWGMLLSILPCTGRPPQHRAIRPRGQPCRKWVNIYIQSVQLVVFSSHVMAIFARAGHVGPPHLCKWLLHMLYARVCACMYSRAQYTVA